MEKFFMSYAIIGFGKIGHALAKAFARSGITTTLHDPGFHECLIGYRQARTLSRITPCERKPSSQITRDGAQ
jgi:predicted dinucleotide-binding enzyme